jgi:hypothetical protein
MLRTHNQICHIFGLAKTMFTGLGMRLSIREGVRLPGWGGWWVAVSLLERMLWG